MCCLLNRGSNHILKRKLEWYGSSSTRILRLISEFFQVGIFDLEYRLVLEGSIFPDNRLFLIRLKPPQLRFRSCDPQSWVISEIGSLFCHLYPLIDQASLAIRASVKFAVYLIIQGLNAGIYRFWSTASWTSLNKSDEHRATTSLIRSMTT